LIAPRPTVTDTKGTTYPLSQLGGVWVIEFAGGKYFLTNGNDPTLRGRAFLKDLPKNTIYPRVPVWIATPAYPLVLDVDGTIVRARPGWKTRDMPAETFRHPRWNLRVQALERGLVWMFSTPDREESPGGKATEEQTPDDVAQLAREWLSRSAGGS
jgi:hypothetical protein